MSKIFISYSHDSAEHKEKVLQFSERLRQDGFETLLDRYVKGTPPEGWPRWMLNQLDAADFVLIVCTETYYRRFRGHEVPEKGKGVDWEGALITQELYDSKSTAIRFVPMIFASKDGGFIPEPLRAATYYTIASESGYQQLYDFLRGVAGVEPGPVGEFKPVERIRSSPLLFGEQPEKHQPKVDVSRIDRYAPEELIGREAELKVLNEAWAKAVKGEKERPNILTFVAMGGEGKTSLVAKWVAELAYQGWQGCEDVFAWSFYSQGTKDTASADLFLKEALSFFGDDEMANSAVGAYEKGRRLVQLICMRRVLLFLDGLEPLQYSPASPTSGELKDQGVKTLLKGLAAANSGLCVITTRHRITDLRNYWNSTSPQINLSRLSMEAGIKLLGILGVRGTLRELGGLVEDVKGHALTLNLLGTYLNNAHGGDARKHDLVNLKDINDEIENGHAFRVVDAYVKWFESDGDRGRCALAVLRLMGLFDRPADEGCIASLLKPPAISGMTRPLVELSRAQFGFVLNQLESARLLTISKDKNGAIISLDTHPLLREYFSQQCCVRHRESWRAAHRRLYEHLCESAEDTDEPVLEHLLPLYHAVAHGCLSGRMQETCEELYYRRLRRRNGNALFKRFGLWGLELGALSYFFDQPWSRVSPMLTDVAQVWLAGEAGLCLHALGRLTEAVEPMRSSLGNLNRLGNWKSAATIAGNLSELELTLGRIEDAVGYSNQAIQNADRCGDLFERMKQNAKLALALHQSGLRNESMLKFEFAEKLQVLRQARYPLLYSVQGFHYCDLMLGAFDGAIWRFILNPRKGSFPEGEPLVVSGEESDFEFARKSCNVVYRRAERTMEWYESADQSWSFDAALTSLSLARANLGEEIFSHSGDIVGIQSELASAKIETAMSGLMRTGHSDYLVRGYLARAFLRWLRRCCIGFESSQADLDEAWEIAERGPMKLFMADIHLYRARLFFREEKYPWESPLADLEAAEKLINECGYHRRDEELAEAKRVILGGDGK